MSIVGGFDRARLLIILFVVAWSISAGSVSAAFKHVHEGMALPEIEGRDLRSGDQVTWKPGGDGATATMVVFWATWSPRSLELLADLEGLLERHSGSGLQVIAINVDGQGDSPGMIGRVREVLDGRDLPFPVIGDPDLALFAEFGVIAVPSVAICGADGELVYGPSGYSHAVRDRIEDSVDRLLGGDPIVRSDDEEGYRPGRRAVRYHGLARRMQAKGMGDRALENAAKAIAADSLYVAPVVLQGQVLADAGRWDEAVSSFRQAVALAPDMVVAQAGLGHCLLGMDDYAAAEEVLEQARTLDETYTPVLLDLARVRFATGRADEAAADLASALELNPRDPQALFMAGQRYRAEGDPRSAVAAYRAALEQLLTLPLATAAE